MNTPFFKSSRALIKLDTSVSTRMTLMFITRCSINYFYSCNHVIPNLIAMKGKVIEVVASYFYGHVYLKSTVQLFQTKYVPMRYEFIHTHFIHLTANSKVDHVEIVSINSHICNGCFLTEMRCIQHRIIKRCNFVIK